MRKPDECRDMQDIRAEIDRIDQAVIRLLSERFRVCAAGISVQDQCHFGARTGSLQGDA